MQGAAKDSQSRNESGVRGLRVRLPGMAAAAGERMSNYDEIYLQVNGERDDEERITWCADKINNTDVRYIRADRIHAAFVALANDHNYSSGANEAWKILGEVLDVVHSSELADA